MMTNFNERTIKALKVTKQTEISDGGAGSVRALKLIASPTGTHAWQVRYTSPIEVGSNGNGKPKKKKIGSWPSMTVENARQVARRVVTEVDAGRDPFLKVVTSGGRTVADLWGKYQTARLNKLSAKHQNEVRQMFKRDILPAIENVRLGKLSAQAVAGIWEAVEERGQQRKPGDPKAGQYMAERTYEALNAFFTFSVDRGWIPANPIQGLRYKVEEKVSRDRWLTMGEVTQFWTGLEAASMNKMTADVFRLLLLTGQRTSEVTRSLVSDYDLKNAVWTLPIRNIKNKKPHRVPLSSLALAIVENAIETYKYKRASSGLLFPAKPRSKLGSGAQVVYMDRSSTANTIRNNLEVMGFAGDPFIPHDLRRTMTTNLAEVGVEPHVLERLINHQSGVVSGIAAVYNRSRQFDAMRRATDLWDSMVRDAICQPIETGEMNVVRMAPNG